MVGKRRCYFADFKIQNQNQKFKVYEHALTNFRLSFVISDVLPHFFLFSSYTHDGKVQY